MSDEPNLGDYIAKWSKVNIRAPEQELSARQEHAQDSQNWLRARIAELERENARLRDELKFCRDSFAGTESALRQEVELQRRRASETERQTSACVAHWQDDCQKLTAENARLQADAERLDWLEANGCDQFHVGRGERAYWWKGSEPGFIKTDESLRSAIDAARSGK
jgi:hypothetical protein